MQHNGATKWNVCSQMCICIGYLWQLVRVENDDLLWLILVNDNCLFVWFMPNIFVSPCGLMISTFDGVAGLSRPLGGRAAAFHAQGVPSRCAGAV